MKPEKTTHTQLSNEQSEKEENSMESVNSKTQQNETLEIINQIVPSIQENERIDRLINFVSQSNIELSNIKRIIENRLSYDKAKEDAFERLYGELEDLKKNSFFERSRPLFIDLILLFDRLENYRQTHIEESSQLTHLLKSFSEELLEILCRQGIDIIASSKIFDPTIQRAINIEITFKKEEDNKVSEVIRKGFRYFDNIVRPEEVIVKKFKQE
jgi:molecular chaperone GrpE